MPLLSRFQQYNIRASLDKLGFRNRGVGQNKNSRLDIMIQKRKLNPLISML